MIDMKTFDKEMVELVKDIDKKISEYRKKVDERKKFSDAISLEYHILTRIHSQIKNLLIFFEVDVK